MKEIHAQIESESSKDKIVIPFFFWNSGSPLQRSVKGMLKVFVARILQQSPNVHETILLPYKRRKSAALTEIGLDWEISDLKNMLLALLSSEHSSMAITFLVDALDECDDTSIRDLFLLFEDLCIRRSSVRVNVCVSSRQIPIVVSEKYSGFSLEEKNQNDIANCVKDKLMEFKLEEERSLLQEVQQEIITKANGNFLWAELVMIRIKAEFDDGNTLATFRKSLSELPDKLTTLFEKILTKVPQRYHEERDRLLGIILCSHRPMNISEVRIAMAMSTAETRFSSHREIESSPHVIRTDVDMVKVIGSRCGGLVETKKLKDTPWAVQFYHQSVRDYLAEKDKVAECDSAGRYRIFLQGHSTLSKACVRYSTLPELRSLCIDLRSVAGFEDDLDGEFESISRNKYPFLGYAINNWMQHCEKAETSGIAQTDEIQRFEDDGSEKFETWLELYNACALGPSLAPDTTPFLIAVMYNLKDFVLKRLEQGVDLSLPIQRFGQYLHAAAICGQEAMINILITHGAEVNAIGGAYHTALQAAAHSGSKDAVEALLNAGGDIGLQGGYYGDPLYASAYQGHTDIVDLLLNRGAKVADDGGYNRNALRAAAETGRNSVVQTLLARGADASAYDETRANILFWAVYSSSESTVKVLIEKGTDIRTWILPGFTILHWLSLYGHEDTVALSLSKGAEIEEPDFNGSTPLHWAASNFHPGVLESLIEAGCDSKVANNYAITPLHFAAGQAGLAQIQVLLDGGADLYARDLMGFSVLHYAALNRNAEVLGCLLDDDLDLDLETEDVVGRRPIHIAAEFGCLNSLRLLADKPVDLEGRDFDGGSILHAAARHKSEDALLFCLKKKIDVSMGDNADMTALHHVFVQPSRLPRLTYLPRFVDYARHEIQRMWNKSNPKRRRRKNKKGEAKNDEWMRLESSDGEKGQSSKTAKINLLLNAGADIDAQDENGNTALHLASSAGNVSAVRTLLLGNANHRLSDSRGSLPIDVASCEEVREILSTVPVNRGRKT